VFNLDPAKLLVIAVVAVILLGPDKLPQVARQAGAAWRTFNEFRHRMESEVRSSIPDLPSSAEIARLARSPTALLNHLSKMPEDPAAATARDPATSGGNPGDEPAGESVPPPSTTPPGSDVATPGPGPGPGDPSLN
jgi:sec-independent protein translocase protein TatB